MEELEEKRPSNVSWNKLLIALFIFLGFGFLISNLLSYNQISNTQSALETRVEIGNQLLELNKQQVELMQELSVKIDNLQNKLDNVEKTGKSNR